MQLPVDIKAVIEAATNIDEASQTPLSISIYMDETSPGDIQAHVRQAFASASVHARVSMLYFPSFPVVPAPGADMAVIVAGLDDSIGKYAAAIRDAGVPVMIVTTLPALVREIAEASGYPILEDDLVSPHLVKSTVKLPDKGKHAAGNNKAGDSPQQVGNKANGEPRQHVAAAEPYPLSEEYARSVSKRMGEWVVDACYPKRLAFAFAFKFVRRPLALEAVWATAVQNAGIGFVAFIPGADLPVMTLNQAKMLLQIAAAYGQPMSTDRVKELAVVVGGAFAFRGIARQIIGVVPAIGWVVKGAIGFSGTMAMGRAAIEYFEADGGIDHFLDLIARVRDKTMQVMSTSRVQGATRPIAHGAKAAVSAAQVAANAASKRSARL